MIPTYVRMDSSSLYIHSTKGKLWQWINCGIWGVGMIEKMELNTFRPVSSTQTTITHATLHLVIVYHVQIKYIFDFI